MMPFVNNIGQISSSAGFVSPTILKTSSPNPIGTELYLNAKLKCRHSMSSSTSASSTSSSSSSSSTHLSHFTKYHFSPVRIFTASRRISISSSFFHSHSQKQLCSQQPVRNAHITILTDFSSNPFRAVRDRMSDSVFLAMLLISVIFGALFSRFCLPVIVSDRSTVVNKKSKEATENKDNVDAEEQQWQKSQHDDTSSSKTSDMESFEWLNQTIRPFWRLLRKIIGVAVRNTLQPALNRLDYPSYVSSVKIIGIDPGTSTDSPKVKSLTRVPSRAESDVQLRFDVQHAGISVDLIVALNLPLISIPVPVKVDVRDITVDAQVWTSFLVEPSGLGIRPVSWALTKLPKLSFSVRVAQIIPLSLIPRLSNLLTNLFSKDLPHQFILPNATPLGCVEIPETDEQWIMGLFDKFDIADKGVLTKREVVHGLVHWGFASNPDAKAIATVLENVIVEQNGISSSNLVTAQDFVKSWKSIQAVSIPRRFRAVVSCKVVQAMGLRIPFFGNSKPYVVVSVDSEEARCKPSLGVFELEGQKGCTLWNENLALLVQQPRNSYIKVEVLESSRWAFYREKVTRPALPTRLNGGVDEFDVANTTGTQTQAQAQSTDPIIGIGWLPLTDFVPGTRCSVWIDLTSGGGCIRLELQVDEFVEARIKQ